MKGQHYWPVYVALTVGCASVPPAPRPAILAPAVDVEKLLPPPPPPIVIPSHVEDFADIRIPTGKYPGLPPGILVSDATHAHCNRAMQQRQMFKVEVGVLHQLRKEERGACEGLLQAQRDELLTRDADAAQARRWASVKLGVGIALGVVAGFAAGRLAR